jgi:peptide deformylase
MIKQIKYWPDPILLEPTEPWNFNQPQLDYETLEKNLTDTLLSQKALGLAANQIGYKFAVLAINLKQDSKIVIMYNPEFIDISPDVIIDHEGCLSFPNTRLDIPRFNSVTVKWYDRDQTQYSNTFTDLDARCLQHEIDHLNGKTFKDYTSDLRFRRAWKKS